MYGANLLVSYTRSGHDQGSYEAISQLYQINVIEDLTIPKIGNRCTAEP